MRLQRGNYVNNFPRAIERSMGVVRKILDQTKNPMVAGDVDHRYEDKYALVEFLVNTGIAATLNVLEQLDGFDEAVLKQVCGVVQGQKRSMTLRLAVEEDCEFVEETTRMVESPRSEATVETQTSGRPATSTTYSHKVVTQVKEYHWKAAVRHSITLFAGTDSSQGITLGSRTGMTRLVNAMKKAPFPPTTRPPIDLDLTWLIQQINPQTLESSFLINRDESKTPRRNKQTEEALQFIQNLSNWSQQSGSYFCHTLQTDLLSSQSETTPTDWLQKIDSTNVFVPVVPLIQEYDTANDGSKGNDIERHGLVSIPTPPTGSSILPLTDSTLFLKEQVTSLTNTLLDLAGNFPDPADQGQITTGYEAKLVLLWRHLDELAKQWRLGITYVEEMLYAQLVSAIGKHIEEVDFNAFIKFHNQRLFGKSFSPKPFCYAIRQPNQYPDGEISIVTTPLNAKGSPIDTFSRRISGDSLVTPMSIPLNASTTIEFMGDQILHGWTDTQFASAMPQSFCISARARQFCSFLLVTGNISGPNEFTPSDAIILQNKDELIIELLTTSLPSAKEFRDAIKSLSPEQSRFAKSYRAMQLDSSVFGVCVIQVKPQMEVLLDLPPNSLTKEIQMSHDLLSLFADYQIPPNLVSYDGGAGATTTEKVAVVNHHVKRVLDVIGSVKNNQLQEESMKADVRSEMHGSTPNYAPQARSGFSSAAPTPTGLNSAAQASSVFGATSSSSFIAQSFSCTPARGRDSAALTAAAMPRSAPPVAQKASQQRDEMTLSTQPRGVQSEAKPQRSVATESANLDLTGGFDVLQDQFSDLNVSDSYQSDDFTAIPKHLDQMFEAFDKDGALRTMTIKTGDTIMRTRRQNLLTKSESQELSSSEKTSEKDKALDLLDALSRSGSLPIASGELHVIIGVKHSFEKNVMATVIEENVNPIEKVDYSSLLIAASVHEVNISALLANGVEPPALVLMNQQFPTSMGGRIEDGSDS